MGGTFMVWMNGRLILGSEARISIFDRGFTLGDGLFETLRVKAGRRSGWPIISPGSAKAPMSSASPCPSTTAPWRPVS